jgi:hypothetical protein
VLHRIRRRSGGGFLLPELIIAREKESLVLLLFPKRFLPVLSFSPWIGSVTTAVPDVFLSSDEAVSLKLFPSIDGSRYIFPHSKVPSSALLGAPPVGGSRVHSRSIISFTYLVTVRICLVDIRSIHRHEEIVNCARPVFIVHLITQLNQRKKFRRERGTQEGSVLTAIMLRYKVLLFR